MVILNVSTDVSGTIQEKVNDANRRIYIAESMLIWVHPLEKDIYSDSKGCFMDDHSAIAMKHAQG